MDGLPGVAEVKPFVVSQSNYKRHLTLRQDQGSGWAVNPYFLRFLIQPTMRQATRSPALKGNNRSAPKG